MKIELTEREVDFLRTSLQDDLELFTIREDDIEDEAVLLQLSDTLESILTKLGVEL
jgi:hypothetical protein